MKKYMGNMKISNRRKGKLNTFSNPRVCIKAELRIFPSPRAYLYTCRCRDEDRNFSKYKSPGRSSGVEFFQVPRPIQRGRIRNFSKSQRLYGGGARNFFKSQGPYRYGSAKSNILTYFFIFLRIFGLFLLILTYSFIFSTYSFIFATSRNS